MARADQPAAVAILEISALGAALVILDRAEKASGVRLQQAELNDFYGFVLKLVGPVSALESAVAAAEQLAAQMRVPFVATLIRAPEPHAIPALFSPPEYQPLMDQQVVFQPRTQTDDVSDKERSIMTPSAPFAIGLIETQGFTAVMEAIDTACKAANVEVIGKEKLGGGYITVVIKGDVAAVTAAIEAGSAKIPALGKLIAAHVIARPSPAVLSLMTAVG